MREPQPAMTDPPFPARVFDDRPRPILLFLRRTWAGLRVVVLTFICGVAAAGVLALVVAALVVALSGNE
jgi:hypothetical protein